MPSIYVQQASLKDIEFIVTCIIEAEKAGTPTSSYERIFGITEAELRSIIKKILLEEVEGCELYCNNYFLAFDDDKPIGGIGAWIEGSGMEASNAIRANNFTYFLRDIWKQTQENLKLLSKYEIPRLPGTLQFEDGYVLPEYHGFQVIEKVCAYVVRKFAKQYPLLKLAQGFTLVGNIQSLISMTKMHFIQSRKVLFDNETIRKLLPGKGKIQWELNLTDQKVIAAYLL